MLVINYGTRAYDTSKTAALAHRALYFGRDVARESVLVTHRDMKPNVMITGGTNLRSGLVRLWSEAIVQNRGAGWCPAPEGRDR